MATIQKVKRKHGHAYVAIINKKGIKSFSKTFKKLSNAKIWAREVEADAEYLAARRIGGTGYKTFHTVVIEYSAQYDKKDKCLLGLIKNWDRRIGHYKLFDITPDLIRSELDKYSKETVRRGNGRGKSIEIPGGSLRSNATINKFKAALSAVFNFAIEQGSMKTNPCRDIKSRPLNNRRERYLTKQEIQALLKACKESSWDQLYLLVMMAITTGARVGELLSLRWKYIDLRSRVAHLPDSKNGEPRDLVLTTNVVAELEKIRGIGNRLVFPSKVNPKKRMGFRKHWNRALVASGIEIGEGKNKVVFHTLRHTAASHLVMSGASSLEVAGVMGHKSLQTTLRYTHTDLTSKVKLTDSVMGEIK